MRLDSKPLNSRLHPPALWLALVIVLFFSLAGCAGAPPEQAAAPTLHATSEEPGAVLPVESPGEEAAEAPVEEPVEEPAEAEAAEAAALPGPDPALLARQALAQMEEGRLLYNPPATMEFAQPERVEARITLNPAEPLEEGLEGSGVPVEETLPVATFMKVRLTGSGFDILPLSSEEQIVAGDTFTQWSWDVTPRSTGSQNLVLVVTARVKIPDFGEESKDIQVVERQIEVQVSPAQAAQLFFKNNLEWLGPAVLAALGAALGWAWRIRKKQPRL